MIEIQNVYKTYKTPHGPIRALINVSNSTKSGEVVVISGPSGSGKSTLLRCLNRLEVIDQGKITIDGIVLNDPRTNINKVREEIGMVFQQFNLFPHKTVLQNTTLAQRVVRKRSREEAERIARELLEKVGIPETGESQTFLSQIL